MTQPAPRLKLLIVVPCLICGGLERNVALICNNIDSSKYDVTLAVLDNENQFFKITNPNVKVIDMKILNVRKSLFGILKLSRHIKPDIILSAANHLNLFLAIFKWLFPKRIKIIARESSIVSINTQRAWHPKIFHLLLKIFYRRLDLIVCQSTYMQQDLVSNYNINIKKTQIIHNPFVLSEFKAGQSIGRDPFIKLITVARLSKEKGLDRLIRAVSKLKQPYRFTIIGQGRMLEPLQELIDSLSLNDKIILAGRKEEPFAVVEDPDLFLMGSYYEGFPNAMLEAIALGIPVVAFNAPGGIIELVNDENGILVEGNNEDDFTAAIEKAIEKKFDKKQIQELAYKRFNIDSIMGKWYDLFTSLKSN